MVDTLSSSGESDLAWATLEEISRQPLDHAAKAQLALQRSWCVLPKSEPTAAGKYLLEFLEHAERDPATVCPQTADRIHCLCIGLPRVAECFERYFALSDLVRGDSTAPWQLAAVAVGAWGYLWRGRREPVTQLLERGDTLHHQFGGIRLVSERLLQFRSLFYAASGQYQAAEALMNRLIAALTVPEATAHRAVWMRAYQHGLARLYWICRDDAKFRALAPTLLAPRMAAEWPCIDTAIELVRGQLAILRQDWRTAETALGRAVDLHSRFRLPMCFGDPRVSLAYPHLQRGERERAWNAFEPALEEVLAEQAVGVLLLEPPHVIDAIFDAAPAEVRRSSGFESLATKLSLWRPTQQTLSPSPHAIPGPLAALSDREREVLAQVASGASNKHIARDLALSLHTVKRHIANILDKLDCASRGQAADLYRRGAMPN